MHITYITYLQHMCARTTPSQFAHTRMRTLCSHTHAHITHLKSHITYHMLYVMFTCPCKLASASKKVVGGSDVHPALHTQAELSMLPVCVSVCVGGGVYVCEGVWASICHDGRHDSLTTGDMTHYRKHDSSQRNCQFTQVS